MTRLPASLLLSWLACGCPAAEYAISVELRTDFVPGGDFVGTRAELFREAPGETTEAIEQIDRPAFGAFVAGQEIGSWTVSPGTYFVRGQLLSPEGAVLAEAVGIAEVTASSRVILTVTRACRGVRCGAGATCMAGSCVDVPCQPGECASECASDGECVGTAACAIGRCESGACWFDSVRDGCAAGEYCDPVAGCVARPDAGVAVDAGVDAGPPDTGTDAGPPPCTPDCMGRTCGMDPVCGTESCGTCSAGLTCVDGACACGGIDAACVAGSCCTPLACGTDGACCTPVQMPCGSVSECCPGRACQMGVCCVIIGDGCSMDTQCCNGHDCNAGRCCVRVGMGCSSDGQCCSNDCFAGACR